MEQDAPLNSSVDKPCGGDLHNEFFNTGRSGRRNALPDILGHHCTVSTADLPDQLSALTTNDSNLKMAQDGEQQQQQQQQIVNSFDASQNGSASSIVSPTASSSSQQLPSTSVSSTASTSSM